MQQLLYYFDYYGKRQKEKTLNEYLIVLITIRHFISFVSIRFLSMVHVFFPVCFLRFVAVPHSDSRAISVLNSHLQYGIYNTFEC